MSASQLIFNWNHVQQAKSPIITGIITGYMNHVIFSINFQVKSNFSIKISIWWIFFSEDFDAMKNIWTFTLDKLVNFKGVPIDFKILRFHSAHLGSSSAHFFLEIFSKFPQRIFDILSDWFYHDQCAVWYDLYRAERFALPLTSFWLNFPKFFQILSNKQFFTSLKSLSLACETLLIVSNIEINEITRNYESFKSSKIDKKFGFRIYTRRINISVWSNFDAD